MNAVIKGKENMGQAQEPGEALEAFYFGFNHRDVQLASMSWAQSGKVVMCNPIGGIRKGWEAIHEGYKKIMQGNTEVYVEFYDYQIEEQAECFYAVGRERGYARNGDKQVELAIRTSRIFQRINQEWKQVHHHGSIDDPDLLKRYQDFINNKEQ